MCVPLWSTKITKKITNQIFFVHLIGSYIISPTCITFYLDQIISCSPALLSSPIVPFLACIFCKLCNEIAYLAIPRSTVVRRLHRFQAAKNKKISIKLRYEIIYITCTMRILLFCHFYFVFLLHLILCPFTSLFQCFT